MFFRLLLQLLLAAFILTSSTAMCAVESIEENPELADAELLVSALPSARRIGPTPAARVRRASERMRRPRIVGSRCLVRTCVWQGRVELMRRIVYSLDDEPSACS